MKKKQKGDSRKRHLTLKTGNTMLNRKNIPAPAEIQFLTKRHVKEKTILDMNRLLMFINVKTMKAGLF